MIKPQPGVAGATTGNGLEIKKLGNCGDYAFGGCQMSPTWSEESHCCDWKIKGLEKMACLPKASISWC
jgi:hypothetical protein